MLLCDYLWIDPIEIFFAFIERREPSSCLLACFRRYVLKNVLLFVKAYRQNPRHLPGGLVWSNYTSLATRNPTGYQPFLLLRPPHVLPSYWPAYHCFGHPAVPDVDIFKRYLY